MKLSSSLIFCMGLIASAAALPAVTLSPAQKSATIAPLSATVFNTHGQNVRGTVPDVTDLTKDIVAVEAAGDSRDITKRETANAATDRLLFSESLSNFLYYKSIQSPGGLDWSDDGCSNSPDNPAGYNFLNSCQRHDFGYRNYKAQGRFTDSNRLNVDNNFRDDLYAMCSLYGAISQAACEVIADTYYDAVRLFGGL